MTLLQRIRLTFTSKRFQGPACCLKCGEHTRRQPTYLQCHCSGGGDWSPGQPVDPWTFLRLR